MRKILLTLIISLFLIQIVSAGLLDVIKEQPDLKQTLISKDIQISESANKYPAISIKTNWDLPLISKDVMDMVLTSHEEICGTECISEGYTKLYEDGILFNSFEFYTLTLDKDGNEIDRTLQPIREYQVYIKIGEEEKTYDDIQLVCKETCKLEKVGVITEKIPIWKPYKVGEEVKAGEYNWKLYAKKKNSRSVDWVATVNENNKLESWANWIGTATVQLTNLKDAYAYSNTPNDNVNSNSLYTGIVGAPDRTATYITFNASSIFGSEILDAELGFYLAGYDGAPNTSVHHVYNDWRSNNGSIIMNETQLTWNNQPCGINFVNSTNCNLTAHITFTGNTNPRVINVTSILKSNTNETITFGLNGTATGAGDNYHQFWSKEYATTAQRPYLNVTYLGSSITLNSPADNYISPTNLINFNCSFTIIGGATGVNMSLLTNITGTWQIVNTTNLTGTTNTTTFNYSLPSGDYYKWSCGACDSDGDCGFASENRTIIKPYVIFNNISYINTTTSGITNPFIVNLTYDSAFSGISTVLNYNGTQYTMSTSDTGTTRIYTYNLFAPAVTSSVNNTFYFTVALSNSSGTTNINSNSYNQTVNPFLIDNCTTNSNVLLNMTMFDEENLVGMNGTIEALVYIYAYGTNNLISTYNNTFNYITPTPARICTNSTGTYRMDYTLKHYGNSSYFQKYRNIQNYTITNSSFIQNVKLYNLLLASAYSFRITLTGTNLNNLVVSVYKQYLSEADYKLVESPITSSSDEAIAHLIPQSAVYNFVISYMGRTIQTFNNYQVTCQNPSIGQCTIILPLGEEIEAMPNFNNPLNVSLTNLLNNTGHVLYTTFVSTNGESHTVRQLVLKNDGYGNTTICNNSASGTTGTITCNIPIQYQNKSFFLQTFVDGKLSGSGLFSQGEDPNWYGADIIIELFMYSSLVLLMTTHPILIVIGAMLGLVFSITLIWISAGSFSSIVASLFFFVAAGVIIIWQISRKI